MSSTPQQLVDALAAHFAESIAALLGETATIAPADGGWDAGWAATISCAGALEGHVVFALPDADGRRISALVMAMEGDVADDAVIDTLKEVCGQAVGAVSQQPVGKGLRMTVLGVESTSGAFPGQNYTFVLPGGFSPVVALRARLEPAPAEVAEAVSPLPPPATTASGGADDVRRSPPPNTRNLDVLLDIELPLAVRFGQTELPLLTLVRLGPGSVIDLKRSADEPVDVMVSGKVIARGEVVVVDGNYGVRVTEVMSTAERIRSMGA
jgi:flagellar motor switch protein FliN/FliY